jgi:hypothetical protein
MLVQLQEQSKCFACSYVFKSMLLYLFFFIVGYDEKDNRIQFLAYKIFKFKVHASHFLVTGYYFYVINSMPEVGLARPFLATRRGKRATKFWSKRNRQTPLEFITTRLFWSTGIKVYYNLDIDAATNRCS